MRLAPTLLALAVALSACTSSPPPPPELPQGFPDLAEYEAVNPANYPAMAANFYSPGRVHCLLDWGQEQTVICGGNVPGMPDSVPGTGCAYVRKQDASGSHDEPYIFLRDEGPCVTAKSVKTMDAGRKLVGQNATCVVGEDDLVACIDTDYKHGFVLRPAGSYTF